jgi:hypothetical protein
VSNSASKGMGIGDCDCDLRWFIGRLLCLAFVGVCLQAERFTEPLLIFFCIPARALLIGYTPVACFHRVCHTKNYLQYSQFMLCCGLATVHFVTIMIWPER